MPRSRALTLAATLSLVVGLAAPTVGQDAPAPPAATPNPVAMETPAGDGTAVRLTTELGDIVIGLFTESAPVASENFLNLATSGYYDGVGFHRAVPGFVLQGGDPEGTGGGGPGYTIADEEVVGEYGRGIVAMARTQEPNSQGSQFFFVLDDAAQGSLDAARTYAIFGRVVEGMDVVDAIVGARPASDLIAEPVRILSATVEEVQLPPEPTAAPPTAAELAADDLAALVPAQVGSLVLTGNTFTSDEVLGDFADDGLRTDLEALAEANGAELELLSVVTGGGAEGDAFITLVGGSIPGVPADQSQDAFVRLLLGSTDGSTVSEEAVAGRQVTVVRAAPDASADQTVYVIPSGDVVWLLVADAASLEEAVTALP